MLNLQTSQVTKRDIRVYQGFYRLFRIHAVYIAQLVIGFKGCGKYYFTGGELLFSYNQASNESNDMPNDNHNNSDVICINGQ